MNELVCVDFHGDALAGIMGEGDKIWISVKSVCQSLGVDQHRQTTKLRGCGWAGVYDMSIPDARGRAQIHTMIPLDSIPLWLATINFRKTTPERQAKLVRYQLEAKEVLARHFVGTQPELPTGIDFSDPVNVMLVQLAETRTKTLRLEAEQARQWAAIYETRTAANQAQDAAKAAMEAITNDCGMMTTLGFARTHKLDIPTSGLSVLGRKASAKCKEKGFATGEVKDAKWGSVKTYPKDVLTELLPDFISRSA